MPYAEVKGTDLIQYPYGFSQLQADNPYTNYGSNQDVAYWFPQTTTAIENGYTLAEVVLAPKPGYDPARQTCTQNSQPVLIDGVWTLGWQVTDFTPQEQKAYDDNQRQVNQQQASSLLSQTDWTTISTVADPAQSQPYLANQEAFIAYRNQLREIAVNPPVVVDPWPAMPPEEWA